MNFDTFLLYFYRSEKPPELRLGQYFMNELYRVNQELYRTIPPDLDPYYDDKLLNECISWVSDRWVDDDDETELIHRAVRNGADLDSL
jgi:hypothetical protein